MLNSSSPPPSPPSNFTKLKPLPKPFKLPRGVVACLVYVHDRTDYFMLSCNEDCTVAEFMDLVAEHERSQVDNLAVLHIGQAEDRDAFETNINRPNVLLDLYAIEIHPMDIRYPHFEGFKTGDVFKIRFKDN